MHWPRSWGIETVTTGSGAFGLDKMTVWRWRQTIICTLGSAGASDLGGVVEADEKFFRESRKGSRQWVRHQRNPINHPKPDHSF
jgi:hypothetical protein